MSGPDDKALGDVGCNRRIRLGVSSLLLLHNNGDAINRGEKEIVPDEQPFSLKMPDWDDNTRSLVFIM